MLGAAFGDYPRVIAAPLDIGDCFKIIPEIFNIADRFQCPAPLLPPPLQSSLLRSTVKSAMLFKRGGIPDV